MLCTFCLVFGAVVGILRRPLFEKVSLALGFLCIAKLNIWSRGYSAPWILDDGRGVGMGGGSGEKTVRSA